MDQLDILKSKWKSQEASLPRYTGSQIKDLLHHKSSSIVKWLLLIAIGEFLFFALLGIIAHQFNQDYNIVEIFGEGFYYGSAIVHYIAIFIFIYLFYKNYKNISADQPSRSLMKNILKTRRTMKYYIWYNMIYIMITGMWSGFLVMQNDPSIQELKASPNYQQNEFFIEATFYGMFFVMCLVICVVLYLIYQLIYGILLKRLKRNYFELKKMEV